MKKDIVELPKIKKPSKELEELFDDKNNNSDFNDLETKTEWIGEEGGLSKAVNKINEHFGNESHDQNLVSTIEEPLNIDLQDEFVFKGSKELDKLTNKFKGKVDVIDDLDRND